MHGVIADSPKERVNLYLPSAIIEKGNQTAKELGASLSELVVRSLKAYIEMFEEDRLQRELKEGYLANREYYMRMSSEWESADAE